MEFKEKAESVIDRLLDVARTYPSSWAILLVYTAAVFILGAVIF